jgi:hypothetical protein
LDDLAENICQELATLFRIDFLFTYHKHDDSDCNTDNDIDVVVNLFDEDGPAAAEVVRLAVSALAALSALLN